MWTNSGQEGRFVPDKGGTTIPFTDYKFGPWARPIWNLPGYFRPAKPGEVVPQGVRH